jgi:hypothetical protein
LLLVAGQQLSIDHGMEPSITNAQVINYPANIFSMVATLTQQNTWIVNPTQAVGDATLSGAREGAEKRRGARTAAPLIRG